MLALKLAHPEIQEGLVGFCPPSTTHRVSGIAVQSGFQVWRTGTIRTDPTRQQVQRCLTSTLTLALNPRMASLTNSCAAAGAGSQPAPEGLEGNASTGRRRLGWQAGLLPTAQQGGQGRHRMAPGGVERGNAGLSSGRQ